MTKTLFLQPRFNGPRFEEHTLPIELAKDLAAYQDLVVELAKHLYFEEHKDRRRVPKGFEDSFSLHLEGVEEGSAKPLLIWVVAAAIGVLPFRADESGSGYYIQARDLVADCISANAYREPLPSKFPKRLLEYFNVLGSSLEDGESVDLAPPEHRAAVLTPERRKALVLAGQQSYTRGVNLVGIIDETDWRRETFRLRLSDGTSITAHLPTFFREQVRAAGGKERTQVRLRGSGSFDAWEKLEKITETLHLELLPNQELAEQFDELSKLVPGWLGDFSKVPEPADLSWTKELLVGTFPEDLPFPDVALTPDGGVFAEWIRKTTRISLEVLLPEHTAELQAVNIETGEASELPVDLDSEESRTAMYVFVKEHF